MRGPSLRRWIYRLKEEKTRQAIRWLPLVPPDPPNEPDLAPCTCSLMRGEAELANETHC